MLSKMAAAFIATGAGVMPLLAGSLPTIPVDAPPRRRAKCPLGEFEQEVMIAVRACQPEAYGSIVAERLLEVHGASLALAQVYVTLKRLWGKEFLSSHDEDTPRPIPGGRKRTCYALTSRGVGALEQSLAFRHALSSRARIEYEKTSGVLPANAENADQRI
jgi:DNA-binding PadR family transcriptional regulator